MEEINTYKNGIFCWVDLATTDSAAAKEFYTEIFPWEPVDTPAGEGMTYTMLQINGNAVAALYDMGPEQKQMNIPPHWMSYVSVDDVDATMAKAQDLGGKVIMEAGDVVDAGRMGLIQDPEGALLALWQPKDHNGAVYKNIPGAISWNEHASHSTDKVVPFYEKLFGWTSKTDKMGETEYTTFSLGNEMAAGLYIMPPDMKDIPPHWLTYFYTDNIDNLIEKAGQKGGKILLPKTAIEGMGYFAVIQDPQNAVFGVFQGS